ncbi:MAG: phosphate ABC transporter permease PstA [Pseudomonadota bacterium]
MVDLTELSAKHTSAEAASRVRKRNASQVRLKLTGLFAIGLAGLALVALLWTVVGSAMGTVTEHYVTISVPVPAEDFNPEGGELDSVTVGRAAQAAVRDRMRTIFDFADTRAEQRELADIVSSGAAFELADTILENPELVGQDVEFSLVASDVADLYYKGFYGRLTDVPTSTSVRVEIAEDSDEASIFLQQNVFREVVDAVKIELQRRADRARDAAQLQDNGVRAFERRLETASNEEERAEFQTEITSRTTERDRLIGIAEDLENQVQTAGTSDTLDNRMPSVLLKAGGGWIKLTQIQQQTAQGTVIEPLETAEFQAGEWQMLVNTTPEVSRKVSDFQTVILEDLADMDTVTSQFNWRFLSAGDSREPELAGIWGAAVGSFWTMIVTFLLAFPIGSLAAMYLEEFAPKNAITDFVEVNINNLAAVPSIVFGLLGLAVILPLMNALGNDDFRSAPLIGGTVLALMTLPTIIIASRAAIRAVPPSIRDAALGVGASKLQTSFHHVLPLAMPGILTGTIIGMAQALGETAPLLMIGMVAFIVDIPQGVTDSASVIPVQIFRWSDLPERAFSSRTSAAICVLLIFLVIMNALAVFLRKRFERRW